MRQHDLAETLQKLVSRHGFIPVLRCLADLQDSPQGSGPVSPSFGRKRTGPSGIRTSAVDYVSRMPLLSEKAAVLMLAAERFDEKSFLPSNADIREFYRMYGVQMSKMNSRTSSIPRVFNLLAFMDSGQIASLLGCISPAGSPGTYR